MYGRLFYTTRREWTREAARAALPAILELTTPSSMVDVGCGTGIWLSEAERQGVRTILGTDGPWVSSDLLEVKPDCFRPSDLSKPLELGRTFDLAMSLEVAEHLPPSAATGFVSSLCGLAPVVVFSAAIPGQGGENHVNEQWPGYWIGLFEMAGFRLFDVLRPALWNEGRIPYWYRQNLLLFASSSAPEAVLQRLEEKDRTSSFRGANLVHPVHAERALQYPGLGALGRAFPYALVRSLSSLWSARSPETP
jgi:SAM-dependent methyltransferase